jgi:hypothetical protein
MEETQLLGSMGEALLVRLIRWAMRWRVQTLLTHQPPRGRVVYLLGSRACQAMVKS